MKIKKILIFAIATFSLLLSGCNSDSVLEKYSNPELFLSHVERDDDYFTISSNQVPDYQMSHYQLDIKEEILKAAPFESVSFINPSIDRYFTYRILISHATSGPNYASMQIYADGSINITAKASLANPSHVYFKMDETKADNLNNYVANLIKDYKNGKEEDSKKLQEQTNITNFFLAMDKLSSIPVGLYYQNTAYNFIDNCTLLTMMKEIDYQVDEYDYRNISLTYNDNRYINEKSYPYWKYMLDDKGEYVELECWTEDRFLDLISARACYKIDASKGQSLILKAYELAK